jgi:hypothetical protein
MTSRGQPRASLPRGLYCYRIGRRRIKILGILKEKLCGKKSRFKLPRGVIEIECDNLSPQCHIDTEREIAEKCVQRLTLLQFSIPDPHAPHWTRSDIARVSESEKVGYGDRARCLKVKKCCNELVENKLDPKFGSFPKASKWLQINQ